MFNWLRKKSENKSIDKLNGRLDQIEQAMIRLSEKEAVYHIHIEQLQVQQPVLENLTFRLDQLDIEQLSGTLNLGNNFTSRVERKEKLGASSKAEVSKQSTMHSSAASIEKTSSGFKCNLDSLRTNGE